MSKIVEFIKAHPIAIAGSIMGLGLLYLLFSGSSSSASTSSGSGLSSVDAAEVQANSQLQEAQLAANQQSAQVQSQANVDISGQNTQLAEYQLQAQTTQNVASTQANNSEIIAQLQAQTTQVVSGLQAQVADTQTAAQVATTQLNDNALVTVALAPYESLNANEIAQLNANTQAISGLGNNLSGFEGAVNNQLSLSDTRISSNVNQLETAAGTLTTINSYGTGGANNASNVA